VSKHLWHPFFYNCVIMGKAKHAPKYEKKKFEKEVAGVNVPIDQYAHFGKNVLRAFPDDQGVCFYLPRGMAEKKFWKLKSILSSRSATTSEGCHRLGFDLSMRCSSIEAGIVKFTKYTPRVVNIAKAMSKVEAKVGEGVANICDTPEWKALGDVAQIIVDNNDKLVKSGAQGLHGILDSKHWKDFRMALDRLNTSNEGDRGDKQIAEAIDAYMKFNSKNVDDKVTVCRKLTQVFAPQYLMTTSLLEGLAFFSDLPSWAGKIQPIKEQPKAVQEWVRHPGRLTQLKKALVASFKTKMSRETSKATRAQDVEDEEGSSDSSHKSGGSSSESSPDKSSSGGGTKASGSSSSSSKKKKKKKSKSNKSAAKGSVSKSKKSSKKDKDHHGKVEDRDRKRSKSCSSSAEGKPESVDDVIAHKAAIDGKNVSSSASPGKSHPAPSIAKQLLTFTSHINGGLTDFLLTKNIVQDDQGVGDLIKQLDLSADDMAKVDDLENKWASSVFSDAAALAASVVQASAFQDKYLALNSPEAPKRQAVLDLAALIPETTRQQFELPIVLEDIKRSTWKEQAQVSISILAFADRAHSMMSELMD
jgi:uncharacterized membrane protein YgcG